MAGEPGAARRIRHVDETKTLGRYGRRRSFGWPKDAGGLLSFVHHCLTTCDPAEAMQMALMASVAFIPV